MATKQAKCKGVFFWGGGGEGDNIVTSQSQFMGQNNYKHIPHPLSGIKTVVGDLPANEHGHPFIELDFRRSARAHFANSG